MAFPEHHVWAKARNQTNSTGWEGWSRPDVGKSHPGAGVICAHVMPMGTEVSVSSKPCCGVQDVLLSYCFPGCSATACNGDTETDGWKSKGPLAQLSGVPMATQTAAEQHQTRMRAAIQTSRAWRSPSQKEKTAQKCLRGHHHHPGRLLLLREGHQHAACGAGIIHSPWLWQTGKDNRKEFGLNME